MLALLVGLRGFLRDWHGTGETPGAMERIVRIDERVGTLEKRFDDPFLAAFQNLRANGHSHNDKN